MYLCGLISLPSVVNNRQYRTENYLVFLEINMQKVREYMNKKIGKIIKAYWSNIKMDVNQSYSVGINK